MNVIFLHVTFNMFFIPDMEIIVLRPMFRICCKNVWSNKRQSTYFYCVFPCLLANIKKKAMVNYFVWYKYMYINCNRCKTLNVKSNDVIEKHFWKKLNTKSVRFIFKFLEPLSKWRCKCTNMVDLYSYLNAIVYLAFGTLKKNCITKANNRLQIKNSFEM